jgi:hypothetical protein
MTFYKIVISSIWWGAGLTIIAVFLWLTTNPKNFGPYWSQALDWILPQLIPTMTLTGAVAYAQGPAKWTEPPRQVRFAFMLTCLASIFYLALVVADIIHALSGTFESERGAVDALNEWNKILGVFQGLAASAIGVFFIRSDAAAKEAKAKSGKPDS